VKGLSEKTIEAILTERRSGGRFHSLLDLMARVTMSPQEIMALVKVGACDDLTSKDGTAIMSALLPVLGSMGEAAGAEAVHEPTTALNRRQMIWLLPSLLSLGEGARGVVRRSQMGYSVWTRATGSDGKGLQIMMSELIEGEATGGWGGAKIVGKANNHRRLERLEVPLIEDYTLVEKLKLERDALGFVLSCNEMELVDVQGAVPSSQLRHYADRQVQVAGVIAAGRTHTGKDGNRMLFLTLQDREGLIEVVVFSDAYKEHGELLASNGYGPYTITGIAQVTGKGRGIGIQPPSDLLMANADAVSLKMHPVLVAEKISPLHHIL
jgi:DNA polymerase III alpha subunit